MPQLKTNTLTRVSVDELGDTAIYGGIPTATLTYLSGADDRTWDTSEPLTAATCPDLITATWETSGVSVAAGVDLVAAHYCTLDEIRAYRETAYQLTGASDEETAAARAQAEELIERECHRFFTPVLREALIERTNCTGARYPIVMDGYAHDLRSVVSAVYVDDGSAAKVKLASDETVDVTAIKQHRPVRAVLEIGASHVPAEVKEAVIALAAWYMLPKAGPDNATSESTDAGVLRFVVGGVGGAATSLPAVNAAIDRYGVREWNMR